MLVTELGGEPTIHEQVKPSKEHSHGTVAKPKAYAAIPNVQLGPETSLSSAPAYKWDQTASSPFFVLHHLLMQYTDLDRLSSLTCVGGN